MNDPKKWSTDRQVGDRYQVARVSVWRWAKEIPDFPKPHRLGPNTVRWLDDELDAYDRRQIEKGRRHEH